MFVFYVVEAHFRRCDSNPLPLWWVSSLERGSSLAPGWVANIEEASPFSDRERAERVAQSIVATPDPHRLSVKVQPYQS